MGAARAASGDPGPNTYLPPAAFSTVIRGDGVGTLKGQGEHSIDLVFLDPPFDSHLFEPALQAASLAIAAAGFVYLEAPKKWPDEKLLVFRLTTHRYLKAGAVHAHLLKRAA